MEQIIEVKGINKQFLVGKEKVTILNDVSFSVEKGEFVSIMGPSGCGKSTLLYLLGGLDDPTSGEVLINSRNIHKLKDKEKSILRRRTLGFIFQFYNLVANLNVEDNIMLPVLMDGEDPRKYREELNKILDIVGLTERRNYTPRELSGGQQQRVAIARALITSPDILLADEPIGNLDSKSGIEVMKLFQRINQESKVTIIQVTHSLESTQYGSKIIHMKDGVVERVELLK